MVYRIGHESDIDYFEWTLGDDEIKDFMKFDSQQPSKKDLEMLKEAEQFYTSSSSSSSDVTAVISSTSANHLKQRIKDQNIEDIEAPVKGFGWIKGLPDIRDLIYEPGRLSLNHNQGIVEEDAELRRMATIQQPRKVDLRDKYDKKYPIMDQGDLGSCTAFAIGSLLTYNNIKQDAEDTNPTNDIDSFTPSHLFIYYNERVMINTVNSDSGAIIRDGIKSVVKQGVCRESYWPYQIEKFTQRPSLDAYQEALKHQAILYFRINNYNITNLKAVLVEGYPFVFGFSVYTSFMSSQVARTGLVPMPKTQENLLGGHAVICVGYDDNKRVFICRNQWGNWGDKGYFYMPYNYLTSNNLVSDFWVIKKVEVENDAERQTLVNKLLERQLTKWKQDDNE
jgi:C1A family cysteine protease